MALYRVISLDLRTGVRVAEIELSGLTYSQKLNGVGEVTGSLKLPPVRKLTQSTAVLPFTTEDGEPIYVESNGEPSYIPDQGPVTAAAVAQVLNDAVRENVRHLFVERNGIVVGDGIVWDAPYDDNTQTYTVRAASTLSYFGHRFITAKATFAAVDQLAIARSLINTAQAATAGNIGVTVGAETSGVLRDRTYESFDLKVVADALSELAAVEGGFDYAIDCSWHPVTGAPVKQLNLSYPRRGRTFSQTGHVFELVRNIVSFKWPSSGSKSANRVHGIGDGNEGAAVRSVQTDATQLQSLASGGPGYPLLEGTYSNREVKLKPTLDAQTLAHLRAVSKPVTLPEITVRADRDPMIGSYIVGDACRVVIPPNKSPRFPTGLNRFYRIIGYSVSVSDEGAENVTLTLGEET